MKAVWSGLKLRDLVNNTIQEKKKDKYKYEGMVSFPLCFYCFSEKKEIFFHQEGNCFVTKMVLDCLLGIF